MNYRRFLTFFILALLGFLLSAQPQPPSFFMRGFRIIVDIESMRANDHLISINSWPRLPSAVDVTNKDFSGRGHLILRSHRIEVNFRNVRLAFRNQRLLATNGSVDGQKLTASNVTYQMDGFEVLVKSKSLHITPEKATAWIRIVIPTVAFAAPNQLNPFSIVKDTGEIAADGSICGNGFQSESDLVCALKDTVYSLKITTTDTLEACIGSLQSLSDSTFKGVRLSGNVFREGVDLFTFTGTISVPGYPVKLEFTVKPVNRNVEGTYILNIKSGQMKYFYDAVGLQECDGTFIVDLTLPPTTIDPTGQTIYLANVSLQTNKSGALFDYVRIPRPIKVGPSFEIEVSDSGARAYLPNWHKSNPTYGNPDCLHAYKLLGIDDQTLPQSGPPAAIDKRPGVTIFSGILYFKSRQVSFSPTGNCYEVIKTKFFGGLTILPRGIVGELTGSGYSFIQKSHGIDECEKNLVKPPATWAEILGKGDMKPVESSPRFFLSGMQILEMRVERLRICHMERVSELSSTFRYVVHFPYPSFIDLEFEDKSLDSEGRFHIAKGPIGSRSVVLPPGIGVQDISTIDFLKELPKGTEILPNPDTQILWAWRLPVSFSPGGVTVTHLSSTCKAEVSVSMAPFDPNNPEISSSEIWMPPLYSRNSAIQHGVRFSAVLDADGLFHLIGWDNNPFLAKSYARPGMERKSGFDCQLNAKDGIVLATLPSSASSRIYDFFWKGKLQFPFFGYQETQFKIKDLLPLRGIFIQVAGRNSNCDGSGQPCLDISVKRLVYSRESIRFESSDVQAISISSQNRNNLHATSIFIASYINGLVYLRPVIIPEKQIAVTQSSGACGNSKWIKHWIKDAIYSDYIIDLVCYDREAGIFRGDCADCSKPYYTGTYLIEIGSSAMGPWKMLLSVPEAKCYGTDDLTTLQLKVNNSEMRLSADDIAQPNMTVLNIPSAQLAFLTDGTFYGSFGATLSPVASSLPYEGEFQFYLNPNCGYYYILAGGSFTFYLRFSGYIFIVHAPYGDLSASPPYPWVSTILEDLKNRSLFRTQDDFKSTTHLNSISPNTVITGVFTAGTASFGCSYGPVGFNLAAGCGNYIYQFNNSNDNYVGGFFLNSKASANLYLVTLEGYSSFAPSVGTDRFPTLGRLTNFLNSSEFTLKGSWALVGEADLELVKCSAGVTTEINFSSKNGLSFQGFDFTYGCEQNIW
jgi:hypothetical protein